MMTTNENVTDPEVPEPTVPGWYRSVGTSNWMLWSLYPTPSPVNGRWNAHVMNGSAVPCTWDYIAQSGPVELVAAYPEETR